MDDLSKPSAVSHQPSPTSAPNEDRIAMSHRRPRLLTILASSLALPLVSLTMGFADVVTLTPDATTKGAAGVLEGFARTYKNGRHIGPALESLAKLQIARDNYSGVEQTIAQLSQLPKGDDRAAILRIKILTHKGQLDQAIAELDKVIAGS